MKTRRAIAPLACLGCAIAGCTAPEQPRLSGAQRVDQYLREARLGTPITTVSEASGGVEFDDCEAGSSMYPYWTLRGRVGTVGLNLGATGPADLRDGLQNIEKLKYVGHFLIRDGDWTSMRWVNTDGRVEDSQQTFPIPIDTGAAKGRK
jgi:hypothetical protein